MLFICVHIRFNTEQIIVFWFTISHIFTFELLLFERVVVYSICKMSIPRTINGFGTNSFRANAVILIIGNCNVFRHRSSSVNHSDDEGCPAAVHFKFSISEHVIVLIYRVWLNYQPTKNIIYINAKYTQAPKGILK